MEKKKKKKSKSLKEKFNHISQVLEILLKENDKKWKDMDEKKEIQGYWVFPQKNKQ